MVPDALHGGPLKQAHHFMKAQNYYDLISGMLPFRNISKNSAALHDRKNNCKENVIR
jgi:hypothetical protein